MSQAHKLTLENGRAKVLGQPEQVPQENNQFFTPTRFQGVAFLSGPGQDCRNGLNAAEAQWGSLGLFPESPPWVMSASISEQSANGTPHVGSAAFMMHCAQMDQAAQAGYFTWQMWWNWPLPWVLMIMFGA
jgi:hypothetical protein